MSKITIVGAGLSGMVAAINLARQGYEVLILEKEKQIGGTPMYHPSLHSTPIDIKYTSDFIGIDISSSFVFLPESHTWIKNKRVHTNRTAYGVERGDRESAIDSYLYKLCLDCGVKFEFGNPIQKLSDVPPGSIIATGTMCTVDDFNVHKRIDAYGHSFSMDSDAGPANWQFADTYSPDYFYAVAMNGILYGLVFARRAKVDEKYLDVIDKQFKERAAGIEIKGWKPFYAQVMIGKRLFFGPGDKYIMTGSASGSFDPCYGYGIVGALTSGKVSAMAVRDPEGAQYIFDRMNRHHMYLYYLFEIMAKLPLGIKLKMLSILPGYYKYLKPLLGPMGYGIPGYWDDWVADFMVPK